jgi:hypothetical protein
MELIFSPPKEVALALYGSDKKLKLAFPAVVCACIALTLTIKRAIKNPSFCKK